MKESNEHQGVESCHRKTASNSTEVPSSSARLGALCCMIARLAGFFGTCGEHCFHPTRSDAAWVTRLECWGGTILLLAAAAKGKCRAARVQDKKEMAQMVLFSFLGLVLSQ